MDPQALNHPDTGACCCVLFLTDTGQRRLERHACCPTHWRHAETTR